MASARASSSFLSPPAPSSVGEARGIGGQARPASRISRARRRASASLAPGRRSARRPPRSRGSTACGRGAGSGTCGRARGGRSRRASGPPISAPRNRIEPAVGGRAPEMQLKHVVLPDPFGPMSPRISPSFTSKDTALSAVNPPNRFVSPADRQHRGVDHASAGFARAPGRHEGGEPPSGRQRAANGEDAGSGRTAGPWPPLAGRRARTCPR